MRRLIQGKRKHEELEIMELYRRVFTSHDGRRALAYMLTDLGFFDEGKDEKAQILRNYAIRLLTLIGVLDDKHIERLTEDLVNCAMKYKTELHDRVKEFEEEGAT